MDTTTIALDREAYELLRTAKRPGESFSATVKRIARARMPLSAFAGTWKHLTEDEVQEIRDGLMDARSRARYKARALHRSRG